MIQLTALLLAVSFHASTPCSSDPEAVREQVEELRRSVASDYRELRLTIQHFGKLATSQCSTGVRRDLLEQAQLLEKAISGSRNSSAAERVLVRSLFNLVQ